MLKKILATALAAAMIFGLASTAFAAAFPDIAGNEFEADIAKLKALGLVEGDENGKYNPTNTINRAEFAKMVVNMLGLKSAASYLNTPTVFPDVKADFAWAYGYINIAVGRGLVKGYEDGTFRPSQPVSQAEALTILIRALGYTDNLPGTWPIDYVMKGAELGIISTGFTADLGANRGLVANLINKTFDQNLVKEDKDAPGTFLDKYTAPTTLYKDAFGLRTAGQAEAYVSGKLTGYSTTDKTVTVYVDATVGSVTKTYLDSVLIQGKDTIADLKGQMVKLTLNKDGKVVFIAVTTAQEVVGDITAIDTVNLKVTVGGTAYTVNSDAEVYKNGALVQSTVAGALVAVNGSSAKLLLTSAGKVYRIHASKLDQTGTIAELKTDIDSTGTTVNKMKVGGNWYNFKSTTTIVRNGASAAFADLKVNDDLKFSISGSDLVYVDAFNNVVEDYKVTGWTVGSSAITFTATKDGVETTFSVYKDSNGVYAVTSLTLGSTYDFTLNRDGKVTAATVVTVTGPSVGKVKTISNKDLVYNASANPNTKHRFTFSDASTLVLEDIPQRGNAVFGNAFRNGLTVTADATNIWNAAVAGDLFRMENDDAGPDGYDFCLYAPTVSGRIVHPDGQSTYTINNTSDVAIATFDTTWGTAVTVNGTATLNTAVATIASSDANVATVTFAGANNGTANPQLPKATVLAIESFATTTAYPVKAITSDEDGYTFTLDSNTATVYYVRTDEDTVVMKDGVKATAADIKIGDKVRADLMPTSAPVSPYTGVIAAYVKASTDTKVPTVTLGTQTWSAAYHRLIVTFTTSEACRKGYVWIGGVQKEAAFSGGTWTLDTTEYTTKPTAVTVAAVDYAGNVSSTSDVTLTDLP